MSPLTRLLSWLRAFFSPRRMVVRLPAGEGAPRDATGRPLDVVTEEVRTEGPLKPGHLRQVRRDGRLLPKPKASWGKRRKVMTAEESRRLFSGSLRTRNRQHADLLPDEAQLARYGLPLWRTEADMAEALSLSVGQLRAFSVHRARERTPHYVTFAIPKRSGGERLIHAPKRRLKAVQRRLKSVLVDRLPVSAHAHGFVTGRSVRTHAGLHVGRAVVLKMDLQDFFPTVTAARVRGLLVALGYGYPVAATLALLMTEAERQPVEVEGEVLWVPVGPRVCVQGAPTSPGLCNALLLRLDRRLAGLARAHGFTYSRYADDVCFSGDDAQQAQLLVGLVRRCVEEEGFRVHPGKTRLMRRGGPQRVTGVTVNQVPGLSRQERRRLRAMLHHEAHQPPDARKSARLDGLLAWVHMLNPDQAARLRARRKKGDRLLLRSDK